MPTSERSGAPACVLLTGGSGQLGSEVLRQSFARGCFGRIIVATRRSAKVQQTCEMMPLDLERDVAIPPSVDTVVHLAGEKRDVGRMAAVNEHGAKRLAEAAVRAGVRRFVHVSSVGVYGAAPHSGVVNETFAHHPRNAYEASKEAGERAVEAVCRESGIECVILQPSNVLGIRPGVHYPLLGFVRFVRSRWFCRFSSDAWVNYVAVADAAAAIVAAAAGAPASGTFIVNTPAPLERVIAWIAEELGIVPSRLRLPYALGWAAAAFGSGVSRATRRRLPIDHARLIEMTNTTRYDATALQATTGLVYPLGAERLVRDLVATYRREGLV